MSSVDLPYYKWIFRHGTSAEWTTKNPILSKGEIGVEDDTFKFKFGDDVTTWVNLPYAGGGSGGGGAVDSVNGQTGVVVLDAVDVTADPAGTATAVVSAFAATLGDSATLDVGTTSGTVAAGDDSRFGSAASDPWVFKVADYGAVGDNSTNDRVAIQDAIDAAVAYGVANEYYAEVHFEPKTYYVGSAAPAQTSGTGFGQYAMIELPEVSETSRKLTLVLRGCEAADGMLHWNQQSPQRSGTVIRANPSGLSPQSINGVNVPPSIIGGPLHSAGNTWTNLYLVMQGLSLLVPENTGILGFDLREVANARVLACSAHVDATVLGVGGHANIGDPTNDLSMALRMPELGNNDLSYVDSFSCEGWYYGIAPGDHFHADRLAMIYTAVAMFIYTSATFEHGITIGSMSVEATAVAGIQIPNTPGSSMPIFVNAYHGETSGGVDIDDPANVMHGEIHMHQITHTAPSVNGAKNLRIINERVPRGAVGGTVAGVAIPSVPSSATPLVNPYWRDATVVVSGGTVTDIKVDGVSQGVTTGPVFVPTGKSIAITYSSAPTWSWITH